MQTSSGSHSVNQHILNPITRTYVFATFPGFRLEHIYFPPGPIYLKLGFHHRSGFGLMHIMAEHCRNLPHGVDPKTTAIQLVCNILQPGADIYYASNSENVPRSSIIHTLYGTAIVECELDGQNNDCYSIITAYRGTRPKGTRLAELV